MTSKAARTLIGRSLSARNNRQPRFVSNVEPQHRPGARQGGMEGLGWTNAGTSAMEVTNPGARGRLAERVKLSDPNGAEEWEGKPKLATPRSVTPKLFGTGTAPGSSVVALSASEWVRPLLVLAKSIHQ